MNRLWLVFDSNYIAYRSFFSTGGLSHGTEPTGVVFGFLRDLRNFAAEFGTQDMIFTFDHGKGLREDHYPWYKHTRRSRKLSEDQEKRLDEMRHQVGRLKLDYLPELGFQNVVYQKGYEADDAMAWVAAKVIGWGDEAVLISGDEDLYQLLSPSISVYHPVKKEQITHRNFKAKYNLHPTEWVQVKALAGCTSDNIPGAKGVGEITAVKYLTGELKDTALGFGRIRNWIHETVHYAENLELVTLPYKGFWPELKMSEKGGRIDSLAWNELAERLGMASLVNAFAGDRAVRYQD